MANRILIGIFLLLPLIAGTRIGFAEEANPPPAPNALTGAQSGGETAGKGGLSSKPMGLGELREWLGRRNQERKEKGLAGPGAFKNGFASVHPRLRASNEPSFGKGRGGETETASEERILHLWRGPDGRVHHRYIVNQEGPDRLEVDSGAGYNPLKPETDSQKWARLTPRGRQLWFGGSAMRNPQQLSPWRTPSAHTRPQLTAERAQLSPYRYPSAHYRTGR